MLQHLPAQALHGDCLDDPLPDQGVLGGVNQTKTLNIHLYLITAHHI